MGNLQTDRAEVDTFIREHRSQYRELEKKYLQLKQSSRSSAPVAGRYTDSPDQNNDPAAYRQQQQTLLSTHKSIEQSNQYLDNSLRIGAGAEAAALEAVAMLDHQGNQLRGASDDLRTAGGILENTNKTIRQIYRG